MNQVIFNNPLVIGICLNFGIVIGMYRLLKTNKNTVDSNIRIDKTARHEHEPFKVVLTGGPCAGKSTALNLIKENLIQKGYDVYTVPETSTILLSNGCKYPGLHNTELLLHYEELYTRLQLHIENTFNAIAIKNIEISKKNSIIIYDRGILDVKAYVSEAIWHEILDRLKLTEQDILNRYHLICDLVSTAVDIPEFFTTDNNIARTETVTEAKELDSR